MNYDFAGDVDLNPGREPSQVRCKHPFAASNKIAPRSWRRLVLASECAANALFRDKKQKIALWIARALSRKSKYRSGTAEAPDGNGAGRRSNPRPSATLEEVAHAAGVSRATVSRVVNGSSKVSPDVRRSVERAIARLGYVPNRAARSLVTRRSDSVGVVITEPTARLFVDPFFPRLLRGVSGELGARDLQLVLLMPEQGRDAARAESYLSGGHVDGVLLVSLHGDNPLPTRLAGRGIPIVVGGRPLRGSAVHFVDIDNRGGARAAVSHLAGLGRRVIATIAGPTDMGAGSTGLPATARTRGGRDPSRP